MTLPEQRLTPGLLRLMEHEKIIEQGVASMLDMSFALERIRDLRDYRERGFDTFESYCQEWWGLTRQHVNRVIEAGRIVRELEPRGSIAPTNEKQVRPLKALDDPEDRAAAWSDAVDQAEAEGRAKPTAKHVERAVAKRLPPKKDHPAPFSDPILDRVADRVRGAETVLDPFAGTGRVHELRDRAGVPNTVGIEIEPEWAAKHPDTIEGDALDLPLDDHSVDAIATSPTYGNRMADHHNANDDSTRLTYKHSLGRDLNENNSGAMQWGDEYRDFHRRAWSEAERVLKPGGTFVVNIKDHIRDGQKQDVVAWHIDTLYGLGLHLMGLDLVPTKGVMAGANADTRVCAEVVLTFRKDGA